MTKREENKLYNAATKRFIAKWKEIFSTKKNIEKAVEAREPHTKYFAANDTITEYFGEKAAKTLSEKSKNILDAAIHGALAAAKDGNTELKTHINTIPQTAFKTIDIDLLLLKLMIDDLIDVKANVFTDALTTLTNQLDKNPNPTITKATIELLHSLKPRLPKFYDEPTEKERNKIAQIFTDYETACKTSNASKNVLKAVGVVIITGICFAAGIVAGAVLGGAVGLAAGAWSGPGAAFSAILGVFKGSLTGWAMAATATAAVTGVVFGTTGAASTSSLFFKPSAVDKAVAEIVALSPKKDDAAESTPDNVSPNR